MKPQQIRRRQHSNQNYTNGTQTKLSEAQVLPNYHRMESEEKELNVKTIAVATLYVLSGVSQPLLMTVVKDAGLGDPTCQLYMLFYYIGPSLVTFSLFFPNNSSSKQLSSNNAKIIERTTLVKTMCIALIDICAQAMNYTGATMAGPTIFAIIYSSVTVWAALYSRLLLSRKMNYTQWGAVFVVFLGLLITAFNSVALGPGVFRGSCLVVFGSSLHAMTYVLSEAIMTRGDKLDIAVNCAIQGLVACTAFLMWQIFYTRPRFTELILIPMNNAHTTSFRAIRILLSLSFANLIHALTFMYTLKYFPSGATSAGVMKGLQAVLVFVFTSIIFCGHTTGGSEMCFTLLKFYSLVIVVFGIILYGYGTTTNNTTRQLNKEYQHILDVSER